MLLLAACAFFSGSLIVAYHALPGLGASSHALAAAANGGILPLASRRRRTKSTTDAVVSSVRERMPARMKETFRTNAQNPAASRTTAAVEATPAADAASNMSPAAKAHAAPTSCPPMTGGADIDLPPALVDDDYCDCADGSDEPHTSACAGVGPRARFVCERDPSERGQGAIAASRVHDGVCDCCDGADEAANSAVRCPDRCGELAAAMAAREAQRREGVRLRDALASRASSTALSSAAMHDAPHPAFATLVGKCFQTSQHEYVYEVCLFDKATQTKRGSKPTSLGKRWAWRQGGGQGGGHANGVVAGALSGGERCWAVNIDRSLHVLFECWAHPEALGHVSERSPCVYEATLRTAAAC